ncbi:MAG: hypothetical protein LBT92_02405 [Rickettsiales bacterium]|nr:hypothetical protein [Rickettsiales bacterium]
MKKILLIFLMTSILLAPIAAWVVIRWHGDMLMAFRKDLFLDIASATNLALYVFVMTKLAGGGAQDRTLAAENAQAAASFLRERMGTGQIDPNSPQWRALFSGERTQARTELVEPEATEEDRATADSAMRQMTQLDASDMLSSCGYEVYGPRDIGRGHADFVAIGESDVMAVCAVCPAIGEIIANDTRAEEDGIPAWFSGSRKYDSPVWHAARAAEAMRELIAKTLPEDSGVEVIPVAVVPNGTIINYDDMTAVWGEMGVRVAGLGTGAMPDIFSVLPDKSGTEVLPSYKHYADTAMEYFDSKQMKKAA